MRKLIAVTYDTEFKAEEVRLQFLKMQKSYLVSLEDAVVVEKKQNGKVKLHQMYNLTALFVLVDSDLTDKVLDALRGTGGTVLQSSLSHEDEAKLQAALNSARAAQKDAE